MCLCLYALSISAIIRFDCNALRCLSSLVDSSCDIIIVCRFLMYVFFIQFLRVSLWFLCISISRSLSLTLSGLCSSSIRHGASALLIHLFQSVKECFSSVRLYSPVQCTRCVCESTIRTQCIHRTHTHTHTQSVLLASISLNVKMSFIHSIHSLNSVGDPFSCSILTHPRELYSLNITPTPMYNIRTYTRLTHTDTLAYIKSQLDK